MGSFIHPEAICESEKIGADTRVWAFAHVLPGAVVGENCNICDGVFIENDVIVGDNVTVKCGVQLWDGVRIANNVFIGPNVTFTNDLFPRSKNFPDEFLQTIVDEFASIGANSTILPGLTIGKYAMVGAGSVVTKDVPAFAKVVGNPARIIGYVETPNVPLSQVERVSTYLRDSKARGVKAIELSSASDLRGSLIAGEIDRLVPFHVRRFFVIYDVPDSEVRGAHAHRACEQFLVCLKGSVKAIVDDGVNREEFILDRPTVGLYMPPMTWGTQYHYSADATLLVLASHDYDPEDYIRDYSDFLIASKNRH